MDEIDEKLARLPADLAAKIKARVREEGDCLIWQGSRSYETPVLWLPKEGPNGRSRSVRRLISEALGIKPRKNHNVTSSCGDLRCVCPAHVRMVSVSTISKRSIDATGYTRRPGRVATLARLNRGRAKLNWALVEEIRQSSDGSVVLAQRYRVSRSTIARVRNGSVWANPPQEGPDWAAVFWRLAA
jgi:hypothetical protein